MEQDEDGHDFAVRHASGTVPMQLTGGGNRTFFKFWLKIFAEFVEKTKNSIIVAVVIGVWIICNLLFCNYKNTKQFTLILFLAYFLYQTP